MAHTGFIMWHMECLWLHNIEHLTLHVPFLYRAQVLIVAMCMDYKTNVLNNSYIQQLYLLFHINTASTGIGLAFFVNAF